MVFITGLFDTVFILFLFDLRSFCFLISIFQPFNYFSYGSTRLLRWNFSYYLLRPNAGSIPTSLLFPFSNSMFRRSFDPSHTPVLADVILAFFSFSFFPIYKLVNEIHGYGLYRCEI